MAEQQANSNSFALLVDEEVHDVSTFLDRVAEKAKTSLAEEEKRQKQIQSGSVNGKRSRGRGYGPGRFVHGRNEVGQFGNGYANNRYEQNRRGFNGGHQRNYREGNGHGGSNSYQRSYGGANGYQFENGGKNTSYEHNNGAEYAYQRNNGGGELDGYRHNYGGMNGSRRNNYRGGDSNSNYGGDSARNAGYHNGNGRGRGENNVSGNEVVEALGSQQNPNQPGANGRSGSDGRGYGGGGHSNFRGRQGQNRRDGFSNNSETTKEGLDGEKEHAISGERNPPVSTDVDKDAKPHENGDSSEKAQQRDEKAREREEKARAREREEKAREREEKAREREEEAKKMTLGQYEKQLHEKRKALELAMKNSAERIVVNVDKDFESMKLVEKKKKDQDTLFIKLDSEKDKPKKKDIIVRKSVSIDEFLKKPANSGGERSGGGRDRGRGRGERGGFRGSFPRQQGRGDATLEVAEYANEFPTTEVAESANEFPTPEVPEYAQVFPILGGGGSVKA